MIRRIILTAVATTILAAPALAQTSTPASTMAPAKPAVTAPAKTTAPAKHTKVHKTAAHKSHAPAATKKSTAA